MTRREVLAALGVKAAALAALREQAADGCRTEHQMGFEHVSLDFDAVGRQRAGPVYGHA